MAGWALAIVAGLLGCEVSGPAEPGDVVSKVVNARRQCTIGTPSSLLCIA